MQRTVPNRSCFGHPLCSVGLRDALQPRTANPWGWHCLEDVAGPSLTREGVTHLGMPVRKGKNFPSEGEEGHGGLVVKEMNFRIVLLKP